MTGTLFIWALAAQGAIMQVQTVPWVPGASTCFAADVNVDGRAEVFVLAEQRLRVYDRRQSEPYLELVIPEGASALDVADVDRDGAAELILILGEAVATLALSNTSEAEPAVLFSLPNQYSRATGRPFPCTLAVDRDGAPMIALPRDGVLEVRDLQGELAESYPVDVRSPRHLSISRPFSFWVNQHAQAGPVDALEFRISSTVSFRALETLEANPVDIEAPGARTGAPRQQREAGALDPDGWPWFAVGSNETGTYRALYRLEQAQSDSTSIRVRTTPANDGGGANKIGPARHYPGNLVAREGDAPDFDGDGFTDILLWKSRQPSLTWDSLSRAANRQTWPLGLSAHVFLPDKQRFSPRPWGALSLELPVAWWITPTWIGPIRNALLRDFNGDGRTDLGCQTGDAVFTIWQSSEGGFEREPAFLRTFPEPIGGIVLVADLEGEGSTTLAIETGESLQILRPWSPLTNF